MVLSSVLIYVFVQVQNPQRPNGHLARAHSHNDYVQSRPLELALEQGFASIEADIFLVDGQLLVGHDRKDLTPNRTLAGMYLNPLIRRAKANKGWVFQNRVSMILLVDIKADGPAVYEALKVELAKNPRVWTSCDAGKVTPRAVTVILSGYRPIEVLAAEKTRRAFIDGSDGDGLQPSLSPLKSASYYSATKGMKSEAEKSVFVADLVARTHAEKRKLRFWATPDSAPMWSSLWGAGVDFIGTDIPAELGRWMRSKDAQ